MNEENKNKISYDEGWQSASISEYPKTTEDFETDNSNDEEIVKKEKSSKQLLITIQLIICLAIALVAFVLKSIGGDVHAVTHDWYYSNLNDSAIFEDNNFDLSRMLGLSTKDEI